MCGVAFSASLVGLRPIAYPTTDAQEAAALAHSNAVIHLKSHSWGVPDGWERMEGPGPLARAALEDGVLRGRNGKGTMFVFASGNGQEYGENANYDGDANSIYTIAVAALNDTNSQAHYSEPGACVRVCAPSSGGRQDLTTTDLVGHDGYNTNGAPGELSQRDYTQTFGGTSAAVPLVAGVCARILQANPNLGWRDVQEILLRSARLVAPSDPDWRTNSARFHFNHKFGAGLVDAEAAVTLATNHWQNLGPQVRLSAAYTHLAVPIPDANSNGVTFAFHMGSFPTLRVEHVTVTVRILHPYRGDMAITLVSPSGMTSRLTEAHADSNDNFGDWTLSSVRHWGESSTGEWTVRIADLGPRDTGVVSAVQLDVYGTAPRAFLSVQDSIWAERTGNGNGRLDPGETITETVVLQNLGGAVASNLTATLSTSTPGVTLWQGSSAYPDLPPNAVGSNHTPWVYRLAKTVPAGTPIEWTHVVTGPGVAFTNRWIRWVGLATPVYATNSFINAAGTAIPDTQTVYSTLPVALPSQGVLDDVDVSLRIIHPYVGDLQLALQHPDGKEIMLSDQNGEDGNNYGTTSTYTTFDDSASQFIYEGTPPYAGNFRPEGRLSELNGRSPNGSWKLRVTDTAAGDVGTLMGWRLRLVWHTHRYTAVLYNTPPVAWPASYSIPDHVVTNLTLLGTDADDDPWTFLVQQTPVSNPFPFSPPTGFTGVTNLAFAVTDGYATSGVANLALHIVSTALDSDGDGVSDWHEFLAGTDPSDRSSVLQFASSEAARLQFHSVPGRTYQIEYKNDLRDTEWIRLLTTNGVGGLIQITDPNAAGLTQRFYRIRLVSPP